MKHLFIINPAAGKRGSTALLEEKIHRTFSARELTYELRRTAGPGDAEAFTRAACATGEDLRIYACGGDGTLYEVVNGAAGWDHVAVTNVPKGTGNDFLKIFGPENTHRFTDLDALLDGPQAAMDLMDCNGRLGIGVVCAGLDARVADDVGRYKRLPLVRGSGAYILSLLVNVLFKGITRHTAVEVDGYRHEGETAIICICNGRYYGGGFMPVGEAQPDDGVLDMLVVPQVGLLTLARLVGQYAKGNYRKFPQYIKAFHSQSITFSSHRELVAVVDGEVLRDTAFTVRLSEKKLHFFYPPGLSYRQVSGTLAAAL